MTDYTIRGTLLCQLCLLNLYGHDIKCSLELIMMSSIEIFQFRLCCSFSTAKKHFESKHCVGPKTGITLPQCYPGVHKNVNCLRDFFLKRQIV